MRVNQAIRAKKVRLIGADGVMAGVVSIQEALAVANEAGLDLIEVAPEANPPVCKVLSYSKWRYDQDQKERDRRKNQVETKEMKFNVRIGDGDVVTKCRKICEILDGGDHVKVVVQMKGRERSHPELASALMARVIETVSSHGVVDGKVSTDQARVSAQLLPKKR